MAAFTVCGCDIDEVARVRLPDSLLTTAAGKLQAFPMAIGYAAALTAFQCAFPDAAVAPPVGAALAALAGPGAPVRNDGGPVTIALWDINHVGAVHARFGRRMRLRDASSLTAAPRHPQVSALAPGEDVHVHLYGLTALHHLCAADLARSVHYAVMYQPDDMGAAGYSVKPLGVTVARDGYGAQMRIAGCAEPRLLDASLAFMGNSERFTFTPVKELWVDSQGEGRLWLMLVTPGVKAPPPALLAVASGVAGERSVLTHTRRYTVVRPTTDLGSIVSFFRGTRLGLLPVPWQRTESVELPVDAVSVVAARIARGSASTPALRLNEASIACTRLAVAPTQPMLRNIVAAALYEVELHDFDAPLKGWKRAKRVFKAVLRALGWLAVPVLLRVLARVFCVPLPRWLAAIGTGAAAVYGVQDVIRESRAPIAMYASAIVDTPVVRRTRVRVGNALLTTLYVVGAVGLAGYCGWTAWRAIRNEAKRQRDAQAYRPILVKSLCTGSEAKEAIKPKPSNIQVVRIGDMNLAKYKESVPFWSFRFSAREECYPALASITNLHCSSNAVVARVGPRFAALTPLAFHTCSFNLLSAMTYRVCPKLRDPTESGLQYFELVARSFSAPVRNQVVEREQAYARYTVKEQEALVDAMQERRYGDTSRDDQLSSFVKRTEVTHLLCPLIPVAPPLCYTGNGMEYVVPEPPRHSMKAPRLINAVADVTKLDGLIAQRVVFNAIVSAMGINACLRRWGFRAATTETQGSQFGEGVVEDIFDAEISRDRVVVIVVTGATLDSIGLLVDELRERGYCHMQGFDISSFSASQKLPHRVAASKAMRGLGAPKHHVRNLMSESIKYRKQHFRGPGVWLTLDATHSVLGDGTAQTFIENCTVNAIFSRCAAAYDPDDVPVVGQHGRVIPRVMDEDQRMVVLVTGDDSLCISNKPLNTASYVDVIESTGFPATIEGGGRYASFCSLHFMPRHGATQPTLPPHRICKMWDRALAPSEVDPGVMLARCKEITAAVMLMAPVTPIVAPLVKRLGQLLEHVSMPARKEKEFEWYATSEVTGDIADDSREFYADFYGVGVGDILNFEAAVAQVERVDFDFESLPASAQPLVEAMRAHI